MATPLQELSVILKGDASQLVAALNSARAAVRSAAGQMAASGGAAGRGFSAPFLRASKDVAAATHHMAAQAVHAGYVMTHALSKPVMEVGRESVHLANDFELAMSRIEGLTSAPRAQVEQFSAAIKGLAPALGSTPEEMARAMYFITSGGLRGEKAMEALQVTTMASVAGLGEVKDVAFAAKAAVNAYAKDMMTAARATDILTATVIAGKVEAADLAPVMGRVLPIASAMGVAFEDVGGAIASMTRVGASAAQASVGIQAMLLTLAKPSEAAREMVEGAGMSFAQLRHMAKDAAGLIKVMRLLDEKFGADESAIATLIPNVRALRAALGILAQNGTIVDEVMGDVRYSVGATNRAFAVAAATNSVKFQMALSQLKVLLIEVGKAISDTLVPVFAELSSWAKAAADAFRSLSPEMKRAVVLIGAAAAAVAPAIFAFATLSAMFSFMWPTVAGLSGAVAALGAGFFTLAGSVLTLGFIPALFVAAKAAVLSVVPALAAFAAGAVLIGVPLVAAAALINGLIRRMGGWEKAWRKLQEAAVRAWDWIAPTRRALADLWDAFVPLAAAAWSGLEDIALSAWDRIFGAMPYTWDEMQAGAVRAIRMLEFSLGHVGDIAEAAATAANYHFTAFGNEMIHLFTRTLPKAAGWGLMRLGEMIEQAVKWGIANFNLLGAGALVGMSVDWSAAFDPKKALGLGAAAKDAAEEAKKVGNAFLEGMKSKEFVFDARAEGPREFELRQQMEKQWGGIKGAFAGFEAAREARDLVDDLVASVFDPANWGAPGGASPWEGLFDFAEMIDRFRLAGGGAAEAFADPLKKGLKGGAKEMDAVLRGSAEDAVRWAQYAESTLRPIQEARIERDRRAAEAAAESSRAGRIGADVAIGEAAIMAQRTASLTAGMLTGTPVMPGKGGGPPPLLVRGDELAHEMRAPAAGAGRPAMAADPDVEAARRWLDDLSREAPGEDFSAERRLVDRAAGMRPAGAGGSAMAGGGGGPSLADAVGVLRDLLEEVKAQGRTRRRQIIELEE